MLVITLNLNSLTVICKIISNFAAAKFVNDKMRRSTEPAHARQNSVWDDRNDEE